MSITNTGGQDFGVAAVGGFITESVSITNGSETVELKDGDGLPVGLVIIPGLSTATATVQAGASGVAPTVGADMDFGAGAFVVTEVSENKSQGDYRRFTINGIAKPA